MRFKKTLLIGVGSILMFTMGGVGPAQADTSGATHRTTALAANSGVGFISTAAGRCASCHRAHTAKASMLLKLAQPALCYSCHDGSVASTNVIDGNDQSQSNTGGLALRGGGFKNARIDSGNASKTMGALDPASGRIATTAQLIPALAVGAPTTSTHQIDGLTAGTAWGNGPSGTLGKSLTLECGSCHDPHGNGNFRILRPIPNGADTTAVAAAAEIPAVLDDPATPLVNEAKALVPAVAAVAAVVVAPVNIPDQVARVYTTGNYWLSGAATVPTNATAFTTDATHPLGTGADAPDGYIQNVSGWCTTCHTRYLAQKGSYKVNSGDATYTYKHRSDQNQKQGAANCITCHVSHGSNAAVSTGLSPDLNPADALATGDSRLLRVNNRGTCSMCHNV